MNYFSVMLIFLSFPSFAANVILTYGPSFVELTGSLDLQTFPGAPNYENINGGDEIERHFYLKLDEPIDVAPAKTSSIENSEKERNVKIVQLSISEGNDKLWDKFRNLGKDGHAKIQGTLFHRFSGHHHSRVLMIVIDMHVADAKSPLRYDPSRQANDLPPEKRAKGSLKDN